MPHRDLNNPEVIKFLVESYEKTARLRLVWNSVHAKKLNKASTFQGEEKGYFEADVIKESMRLGVSNLGTDFIIAARNRRLKAPRDGVHIPRLADLKKGHSIIDVGLGDPINDPRIVKPDTDLTNDPIMRPVPKKQEKIIYKGRPEFGRKVYLEKRCKALPPEERYYFAETSNWDYGWRLKDSHIKAPVPVHGRIWALHREKCRSGPQPDPKHYKYLERGPNKCPES
ncbi:unnamed protein product [Chrysodeixis includens]|uniref:Sperm microtubule inner protein 1 C-terminal domain-containing protein n=1 Tax=Chrysodeixis includens TaxID=689277 RepID=A0A9P0FQV3_CHRIL|nr:unnamed protein product [Chrysodeixis includens]